MITQVCSQITDLNQVIIVRRSSERGNRERVIGTFLERLEVLKAAEDVLLRMEKSGYFDDVDLESFRTTIVGFLREPATNLLGLCSYSRTHRNAKSLAKERGGFC